MATLTAQLTELGVSEAKAEKISEKLNLYLKKYTPEQCWQMVTKEILTTQFFFPVHELLYETVYQGSNKGSNKVPMPAWLPDENFIKTTNIAKLMHQKGFTNYEDLHKWSVTNYADFWQAMVNLLNIIFDHPYTNLFDLSLGIESIRWFPGAKLNIVNSCFNANESDIAIVEKNENGSTNKITYGELNKLSNRVANSLCQYLNPADRVAIIMPMTSEAVAIYLGIIKTNCCVVSIADSFSSGEIATRLRIANVKAVFSQDTIIRDGKHIPLYEKILQASAPLTIVLAAEKKLSIKLREQDLSWENFVSDNEEFTSVSCEPENYTNILFSSGTTGEPKAIPWDHTTPIKCGSDAYLHHNIQPGDIFCWPSSLGWMMGPWSIYASLLNKATIALYSGIPTGENFGKFIQDVKVTHLGVVPTLVRLWRDSACMESFDWSAIKLFSSTGECSNVCDMLYLMSLAHYRPIIEYCGGTEIGGAYITSTVIQPSAPSVFTTPALGLDLVIIDENGKLTNNGEVALIPPSIGLSTKLLNKDHHQVYYANMPMLPSGQILRRHGDQVERYVNGFYCLHGRVDDTMNLGGIKVSSDEIERVLNTLPDLHETAAVAIKPPSGGPSLLIIYAVLKSIKKIDRNQLKIDMQNTIKKLLNPLFKIHDVVIVNALPRTASNKILRRLLRDEYQKEKI